MEHNENYQNDNVIGYNNYRNLKRKQRIKNDFIIKEKNKIKRENTFF